SVVSIRAAGAGEIPKLPHLKQTTELLQPAGQCFPRKESVMSNACQLVQTSTSSNLASNQILGTADTKITIPAPVDSLFAVSVSVTVTSNAPLSSALSDAVLSFKDSMGNQVLSASVVAAGGGG